jgi:hypothetical protein
VLGHGAAVRDLVYLADDLAVAVADGTLRTDVSQDDVLLAMSGIAQSTGQYGTREQAARLTSLLMDALTKGAPAATHT